MELNKMYNMNIFKKLFSQKEKPKQNEMRNRIAHKTIIIVSDQEKYKIMSESIMERLKLFPSVIFNLETQSELDKIKYTTIKSMDDFRTFYKKHIIKGEEKFYLPVYLPTLLETD